MIRYLVHKLVAAIACRRLVCLSNIAEGVHGDGCVSKEADAVQALRHVLVKIGSDIDHVAVTTAGTEIPLGICDDEAAAIGDLVNIQVLGQKKGTILVRAEAAIVAGAWLVAAGSGRAQTLTGLGAATYYIIGRALNAASNQDDLVEVAHCVPVQRVV